MSGHQWGHDYFPGERLWLSKQVLVEWFDKNCILRNYSILCSIQEKKSNFIVSQL